MDIREPALALPEFRYRAIAEDGIVENEFCPVWTALVTGDPVPDPAEVAQWQWLDWQALVEVVERAPWLVSPWCREQVRQLAPARWRRSRFIGGDECRGSISPPLT